MGSNTGAEEERKRRERLEALSKEEAEEAVRNFWRWFEKVRSWADTEGAKRPHASRN